MPDSFKKNENQLKCSDNSCPTPEVTLTSENKQIYQNKVYCIFCFTRKLSMQIDIQEKKEKMVQKTKIVNEERVSRIASSNSFFSKFHGDTTTRIPSTESLDEEKEIWKEIVPSLELAKHVDTGKIISIHRLSDSQGIIIKTTTLELFLIIYDSNIVPNHYKHETVKTIIPHRFTLFSESLLNLNMRTKNWMVRKYRLNIEELEKYSLSIFKFEYPLLDLITFNFDKVDINALKEIAMTFGKYIFRSWFLGVLHPLQVLVLRKSGLTSLDFSSFSPLGAIFDQKIIINTYKEISLKIPFLLDYMDDFYEGGELERQNIELYLKDKEFKEKFLTFIQDNNGDPSLADFPLPELPEFFKS